MPNTIIFDTFETRPDHFPFYLVAWKSLLTVLRDERVILINSDASPDLIKQVPDCFEIVHDPTRCTAGYPNQLRRWRNSMGDPKDKVLFADCRDMLFQRNPFDDVPDDSLIVSGEGTRMGADEWNAGDQASISKNFPVGIQVPTSISDQWRPICAGVYAGQRQRVRDLALMVWMQSAIQRWGTDQGALNYIFNQYLVNEPGAIRCDPSKNDWCMGGHHFRLLNPPPIWDGQTLVCGATGRPYALVHQWDRTSWRPDILHRWQ